MDPPASREISPGSEIRLPDSQQWLNCVNVIISTPVRLPLPGRLSTVLNLTSSLLMLFFVQPLFINSVINCRALWPLHSCRPLINILSSLLSGVKVSAFAWYSVKIRVIFGVRFERREVDKKQTYMKTESCKLYSRDFWIFLPNNIKMDRYIFELYRFKVGPFFETQCSINRKSIYVGYITNDFSWCLKIISATSRNLSTLKRQSRRMVHRKCLSSIALNSV